MEEGRGNLEEDRREGEEKKGEGGERRWRKQGRRRKRNVIWRDLDGGDQEERRVLMEKFMEVVLDRKVGVVGSSEVTGDDGKMLVIVEMEDKKDERELLENGRMMWRRWEVGVDEDLTREEGRIRWLMLERARKERGRGKEVMVCGRRIWIKGKEWGWDERNRG